ncbi:TetR family transcriptional regulator [Deferribacterales bacterium Es71-Z0220]|jgi:TetR/AcrR family fatty acid metabolism transcriptional regulator|uniref:TetR/AcrR family transcriptional regulator n=1 Tax=Deferrivibrio essentukiensis TaxID=2880922 RepID=UPI001F60506D|nr:TetR/AcrR family transcriptional regulator [Deferrivibrio essentukiensis]MCB4204998.1 TetR family transcriptional regulator [Deferrivibrio essentukiensis]
MENNKANKFDKILDSSIKIIGQKGFHGAKVKDIANDAGVADGTIYNYFNNKEDILVTIFKVKLEEYVNMAKEEIAGIDNPEEKLKTLLKYHFKVMTETPYLANVLQIELRQPIKDLRIKVRRHLKNYFRLIEQVIEEGIQKGVFNKKLDVYLAREIYFGTLDEIVSTWIFKGGEWDLQETSEKLFPIFLKAFK